MKKNVVWWIGVKNDKYAHKYGGWEWMDISRKTWEYWCKKNDVLFVPFEKPIEDDLSRFRVNSSSISWSFKSLCNSSLTIFLNTSDFILRFQLRMFKFEFSLGYAYVPD